MKTKILSTRVSENEYTMIIEEMDLLKFDSIAAYFKFLREQNRKKFTGIDARLTLGNRHDLMEIKTSLNSILVGVDYYTLTQQEDEFILKVESEIKRIKTIIEGKYDC